MSLKQCHECGWQVSTDAKRCPACGAKVITGWKLLFDLFWMIPLLLVIIMIVRCTFFTSSDSTSSITPLYDQNLKPDEKPIAEKAYAVFCDSCQPLMSKYSGDIESIEISNGFDRHKTTGCMDYRCREYGWDKQFYIKVKLKEKTSVIPAALRASGHTLHYYLGGPKNAGITTSKIPELCGQTPTSNGKDVYIAEPKLSFIKGS